MNTLFNLYQSFLSSRIQTLGSFTEFGEDSIRYDFYTSLMKVYKLEPHQMLLEQPIPKSQFEQSKREIIKGRGRKEDKPEYDLRVNAGGELKQGLITEFGYFRNPEIASNQDKPGKHGKLLNEIFRLALLKNYQPYSNYRCLFICVTDSEMIKYGTHGVRGPKAIPIQEDYFLNDTFLNTLTDTARNKIEDRFYNKAKELNIIPTATRVININNPASPKIDQWQIWAWEVNYKKN